MGLECLPPLAVVKRVVGVNPIALWVHIQIRDFRDIRVLDEHLAFRRERRNEFDFVVV